MKIKKMLDARCWMLVAAMVTCLLLGASFPLQVGSAQFIDRITRPCSSGVTSRALVITNPNNTGNVEITTCTGGSVTINGTAVVPGGATINPTNTFIPYRSNVTTFSDSPLARTSATIITSTAAFNGPAGGVNTATYSFAAEPTLGWIRGAAGQLTATSAGTIGWFDTNGWHGFGTKVEVFNDTATSTDGFIATTNGNATVGVQKLSPRIRLSGSGWKTDAVAGAQMTDWIIENTPVQGTANPSANLVFSSQVDAGGYIPRVVLTSDGSVGVGITSPTARLESIVGSDTAFRVQANASSGFVSSSFTSNTGSVGAIYGWTIDRSILNVSNGITWKDRGTNVWGMGLDVITTDLVLAYSEVLPGDVLRMSTNGQTMLATSGGASSPAAVQTAGFVVTRYGGGGHTMEVVGNFNVSNALNADMILLNAATGIVSAPSYRAEPGAGAGLTLTKSNSADRNFLRWNQGTTWYQSGFRASPYTWVLEHQSNAGTPADDTGWTSILAATVGGDIGIGTASPGSKLDIQGTGAQFLTLGGAGTGPQYIRHTNTGGDYLLGIDNSVGGNNFTGSLVYATTLGTNNATALQFGTNSAVRMTILSGGNISVDTAGASLTVPILTASTSSSLGVASATTYSTTTNCADSAGAAACGSAAAGAVVIDAGNTSVIVSTTVLTATSRVMVMFDSSLGTELGVTCNTTAALPFVTARTAATDFTITVGVAPAVNPGCFTYWIVN